MPPFDRARWRVVSPLLDQLLDTDPDGRRARLDEIRREDRLLACELEALLSQQAAVNRESFLEGTLLGHDAGLAGQTVGHYRLDSIIGQGGMGNVWLAHRSDGRYEGKAAVKFLNAGVAAGGGAQRFQREGSLLARLSHPNIACLLDAGMTESGQPFLVLQHVDGLPIDEWCDRRKLCVADRVRLFLDVLAAVAHAHSNLILHRDLKPSNILVTADGQVKLLDFGIGKLLEHEAAVAGASTQPTLQAFTPDYAAPEQVQDQSVTTATDVYALGVLLHVLLSGQHPTAPAGASAIERLQAVVHAQPMRLSLAVRRGATVPEAELDALAAQRGTTRARLARQLQGDLENIVARALRKSPAARYATPTAFAEDLRRHLHHEPVEARADTLGYRTARFVARHRWGLAATTAVMLALTIGSAVAVWKAVEADDRRRQAEFNARRAYASLDLLYLMYSDPDATPDPARMLDRLAHVRQVIERKADGPEVKLTLLGRLAGRYEELAAFEPLLQVLTEMRRLARDVADPAQHAIIACGFADAYANRGQFDLAEQEFALARTHLDRLRGDAIDQLDARAQCWQNESQMAALRGDPASAVGTARRAVDAFERLGQVNDTRYLTALNQLSVGHTADGRLHEAHAAVRKAREANVRLGLQGTQRDLVQAMQEAQLLAIGGQPRSGLRLAEQVQADPHVATYRELPQFLIDQRIGNAQLRLHRYAPALARLDAGRAAALAAGNQNFVQVQAILAALALAEAGRPAEARLRLAALPCVDDEIGAGTASGALYLVIRAVIALQEGQAVQADEQAERAVQIVRALAHPSLQLRGALATAARSKLARGQWAAALSYAQAAVDAARLEAVDPESSCNVGEALLYAARAQAGLGDDAAARRSAAKALPHLANNLDPDDPRIAEARSRAGMPI